MQYRTVRTWFGVIVVCSALHKAKLKRLTGLMNSQESAPTELNRDSLNTELLLKSLKMLALIGGDCLSY